MTSYSPIYEPTFRGDVVARAMREVYEAEKPRGFFARRRERIMLESGCSDDLMLKLAETCRRVVEETTPKPATLVTVLPEFHSPTKTVVIPPVEVKATKVKVAPKKLPRKMPPVVKKAVTKKPNKKTK
jgi:hypothetical protein